MLEIRDMRSRNIVEIEDARYEAQHTLQRLHEEEIADLRKRYLHSDASSRLKNLAADLQSKDNMIAKLTQQNGMYYDKCIELKAICDKQPANRLTDDEYRQYGLCNQAMERS